MDAEQLLRLIEEKVLGEMVYTSDEVIGAAGADRDLSDDLWLSLGFPPVGEGRVFFTEQDKNILATLAVLQDDDTVGGETMLSLARVLGQALSRVAAALVQASQASLPDVLERIQAGEEPDEALSYLTDLLVPGFEGFIAYTWRRQLVAALRRELNARAEDVETVGFADLVGFTRETRRFEEGELSDFIDRFQRVVYGQVVENHGRVIKVVGDGVMFAAPDVAGGARIALGLVAACEEDESLPEVRVGLATGTTVAHEGDLYGETVNRASRLADAARPGTVVADDDTGYVLLTSDDFVLRQMRPRRLKGLGPVPAWVVRRMLR